MAVFQEWLSHLYAHLGYPQIILLMALESSLLPVPSELVMIPAGYLAHQGQLNPLLAIACGGLGSIFGAGINYLIGRSLGRAFLLRYGKYLLISEKKYHEAEALFLRNARISTFLGRFLPVIRHLISLPAGVFGMPLLPFVLLTGAGSALWCAVLVGFGYYLGEPAVTLVMRYTHELAYLSLVVLVLGAGWFMIRRR
ncbi:DedA family protein [Nevskia soli]|uniref:DedA family protein n=1 Tax=Nevskia soli TaxID=418856 RepID=UPI0004A6B1DA|nr:DedA family protein [Nevskia soli]